MNTIQKIMAGGLLMAMTALASCSKTDEPSHPVGTKVPYTGLTGTQSIVQILDSLPNCTFYDSAFKHAGMADYLKTLRNGVASTPYTLFVPTDDAFREAGYTLAQIGQTSPQELDSILYYLATPGGYTYTGLDSLTGKVGFYTLLQDPALKRSYPTPGFSAGNPYKYWLAVSLKNGTMRLNGIAVKTAAQGLLATDGMVWTVDKLITKPMLETYQVLTSDTTYSFFVTALQTSDGLYHTFNSNYYFDDLLGLYVRQGRGYPTVLAPSNDAFRKAGFATISDVKNYINNSLCATNNGRNQTGTSIKTNMDSVLDFHRIGYYGNPNQFLSDGQAYNTVLLYTEDMLEDPSASNIIVNPGFYNFPSNPEITSGVSFTNNDGQVAAHRTAYPGGPAVNLIAPVDITTLNGVVHRVDNLLLPRP